MDSGLESRTQNWKGGLRTEAPSSFLFLFAPPLIVALNRGDRIFRLENPGTGFMSRFLYL